MRENFHPRWLRLCALSAAVLLVACSDGSSSPLSPPSAVDEARVEAGAFTLANLGSRIFNDQNLSLRRNQSCASCHDPAWGFTSPNPDINAHGAVMFGSVRTRFGNRRPPSAAYATMAPVLYFDNEDGTYVGGNFWDGRATGARLGNPAAEQSQAPFLNPVEQALPDRACVIYRISHGAYAHIWEGVFGNSIFGIDFPAQTDRGCEREGITIPLSPEDRQQVDVEYDRLASAIAHFENSPKVSAFSSKYDAYLLGMATLSDAEMRGLRLYQGKANCAACHPNDGQRALLTDFTYDNIGVPANPLNPALIADPTFRDLGIGGFFGQQSEFGKQKVPTLRNLDKRGVPGGAKSYMHNGFFKSIEQVVHFYNTRDVLPNCNAVTNADVGVTCWPSPEVLENENPDELGNLGLTPGQEKNLVAYLKTLNDGYFTPPPRSR